MVDYTNIANYERELKNFLEKYKSAKKNDYMPDDNITLKDKFKELWEEYILRNQLSKQSKIYLIQGYKFDSPELLWKYICDKHSTVDEAKKEAKEEFKDFNGNIPSHILELLTFIQELKNHENEISKKIQKIHSLENEKSCLNNRISDLKKVLDDKQIEIENLKNDLAEQKELKSVVAKDEAQKVGETYKKIANELNYGYSTFLEAVNMEMSIELGEVLRDQLKEIYEILLKNGIKCGE